MLLKENTISVKPALLAEVNLVLPVLNVTESYISPEVALSRKKPYTNGLSGHYGRQHVSGTELEEGARIVKERKDTPVPLMKD